MNHGSAPGLFLCFVLSALSFATCRDAHAVLGATLTVTTTADEYDIASPNANCSLREAVQSSNDNADRGGCTHTGPYGTNTIVLATTTYTLTRIGIDDDANSTSDLDISGNVTIVGNGAGNTFVAGGNNYSGRIVHVVGGNSVQLRNLTLKGGSLPTGRAGAGLRSEPGTTTTLTGVVVGLNTADGNAGGILNRGTMTLNGSAVTSNQVLNGTQGGGGLFNDDNAVLTLNDSRVLNNSAAGDEADGGGIYSDLGSTLTLNNTTVADNSAKNSQLSSLAVSSGGGIYAEQTALQIIQSTISGNTVDAGNVGGAGLYVHASNVSIDRTLISGNVLTSTFNNTGLGGGIDESSNIFLMSNSIIDSNETHVGGSGNGGAAGIDFSAGTVINSTISNNHAFGSSNQGSASGGGLRMGGNAALVNSTVVNNEADGDGGGIFFRSGGVNLQQIRSSTIVGNTSNADNFSGGSGGGLFYDSGNPEIANSVIADNLEAGLGTHDDCDGAFASAGYVLIQSADGCTILGGTGNLINVTANLAALADNGGPIVGASNATVTKKMLTRLPAAGSALVDAGNPAGCRDDNNQILTVDQRSFTRAVDGDGDATATCDIGAVERGAVFDPIFADGFD
jgi:CSLREA domain-containing protein